jgi:hypothetical protein
VQGRFWCRSDGVHSIVKEEMRRYVNFGETRGFCLRIRIVIQFNSRC